MRRTTVHDCTRPFGFDGPLALVASGRDLRTGSNGKASSLAAARIEAEAEFPVGTISSIHAEPAHAGLSGLVGASVYAGFRSAVRAAVPEDVAERSVRFQLLDDLPMAVMLSGRALRAAGIPLGTPGRDLPVDICAGWIEGGSLLAGFDDLGPPLHVGPPVPPDGGVADTVGWHEVAELPPHGTRRLRRLDVWQEGGSGRVDAYFRDSHADGEGVETIVHEYAVEASFDPTTSTFDSCVARPGALPYPECPAAAASAGRIVGGPVEGLRRAVRTDLVGPSTCTHLNDTLRSLEDVAALLHTVG